MSKESKRQRRESGSADTKTLKEVIDSYKENRAPYYDSLADVFKEKNSEGRYVHDPTKLLLSTYIADVSTINKFYVPPKIAKACTIKRDASGVVTKLKDKDSALKGDKLLRLMAMFGLTEKGCSAFVFQKNGEFTSALVLPSYVTWQTISDHGKEHIVNMYKIMSFNVVKNVYVSDDAIVETVSVKHIGLNKIASIISRLNAIWEKEAYVPDKALLGSMANIQSKLDEKDLNVPIRNFLQEVLSAHVIRASLEDRVDVFIKTPRASLARTLDLPMIYEKSLFNKKTNTAAERVKLSTLGDDEQILMTAQPIDQKSYESVRGRPQDLLVYEASEDLGVKNRGKWTKLAGQRMMTKKSVLAMYVAIAGKSTGLEKATEDSSDDEDVNDDIDV